MDRGDQPQHGHSGHHDGKACTAAGDQHLHAADEHDLEIGYREELAHPVYAGADLLVVPSVFEPCGLAPMTAMRYGTVPVVRAVGGMTDTVFDRDYSARPPAERNGYVFHQADNQAIESALDRALGLWSGYPAEFRQLMDASMRSDYSWARPGQDYLNIYDYIRHKLASPGRRADGAPGCAHRRQALPVRAGAADLPGSARR